MREALFYKELKNLVVQCQLCPRYCILKHGERGNCRVRENRKGKLYSLVYARPCAAAVDPIEKKPQYHFLPGTKAFSIGTAGCNLHCKFCQNWWMSQSGPEAVPSFELSAEAVVERALAEGCKSIAYTYNDPIVFTEYVLDIAKLAKRKGLKNVFVTNGFINREPLLLICKYIDAFHVDLKGFTEQYYREICLARLKPVLETLKVLKQEKVWFEIINLIVPTLNDDMRTIQSMCGWIKKELGTDFPLHFSRFFPEYKLLNLPQTRIEVLEKAAEIASKTGLKFVYIGNVAGREDNTHCPECGRLLIRRSSFFEVLENNIKKGKCPDCGYAVPGIWE